MALLSENVIHIYATPLTAEPAQFSYYRSVLNAEESERAGRFLTQRLREEYIIAHGFLRQVLASYLDIAPQSIEFKVNNHDKPSLLHDNLEFNLTHSGNFAMVAICKAPVGVDIEKIRPDQNLDIAERFFSPDEVEKLRALPVNEQVTAFFQLWSRKEAIIKAMGKGLAHSLDSFSVAAHPCEEKIQIDHATWYLYPLTFENNYAAAVATATPCQITYIPTPAITL